MANETTQPLAEAVEDTIEQANQAIEQTRAQIARSQALSEAEADLVQAIERVAGKHAVPADER